MKALNTAELILANAVDMSQELLGEAGAKEILTIPMSNDTDSRRIADMRDVEKAFF